ncbi:Type I secretion target repeat protein [Sulfitobacter noctilucicola]|uniref:Hedgehog/Intein (Hint) domain-containing protein n=1 Tax=Sulfitobacter noctilucicola TaxID=1342301 RepID=A0A7W6Q2W5_9RHOB|nr:Hint domain-containing protein [Sulfitobacter noctilucicola]KIN62497.1 Type I secretion target repeat protein [Sulfitobacter noctilucicola]MBB4172973.1 hypothetical protein [Sulfitobacter noctilucicola]
MPFIYLYSPSDFVSALPIEEGAAAAGTPVYTLQLRPDAEPTLVEITDDDAVFDEVDATQSLTNDINLDGATYTAGTSINTAYDLISSTGHKVTSFHFGGDGYQQGAVDGIASTVPLVPGQSYTFQTERTSHQQNNQYTDYTACFTQYTPIDTPVGPVNAGTLCQGDLVITMDHGVQRVRGVLSQDVAAEGAMAPVVFAPGSIGNREEIIVSQQHRMLLSGPRAELLFGDPEVLIPAVYLAEHGMGELRCGGMVRYIHLVFDQHEIVFSNGTPSESFLLSDQSHLPPDIRTELVSLFPDFCAEDAELQAARLCLRRHEAHAMIA